ncbi:MAG: DNA polymerase III subunit gamma/tau [Deltaproteobacteria bacterium CG11_big_fil_rev_8_21_14_0_20_47_16]|nr:MAG: DNA polymerase III subunit gamma/tau [Deltaproteobacteria bacterium CG11_big_fil_rev_8_21_14_0_20_47_16]
MTYQAFARKYRPQTWAAVMGQDHVTRTLANAIQLGRVHHAYLLCGARGIGKTTIARLLAKTVNCTNRDAKTMEPCNTCPSCLEITEGRSLDVQEIDGASNTSVDDVREIRERVKFLPASGTYKVYIIDEVHMLSTSAFNALLKTLEEPPPHVIFVFATTEVHKIPATILSRCQRFDLRRLSPAAVIQELDRIATNENVKLDPVAAAIISRESEGSMRDAESLFDQAVACGGKEVSAETIEQLLGLCDRASVLRVVAAILARDGSTLLDHAGQLFERGVQLPRYVQEVLTIFRHMWVVLASGKPVGMEDLTADEVAQIEAMAKQVKPEELLQYIRILSDGVERLARSRTPRITFETLLLQTTLVQPVIPIASLIDRLEKMESTSASRQQVETHTQVAPTRTEMAGVAAPVRSSVTPVAVDASWETLLSRLSQDKPQMASILSHSLSHSVSANGISVVFPKGSVYADMLKESDRQTLLKGLISTYFGKPMALNVGVDDAQSVDRNAEVRAQVREEKREQNRQIKTDAVQHSLVKDAMNILQAEIKEIKPLKE